jgi:hypothetical protein
MTALTITLQTRATRRFQLEPPPLPPAFGLYDRGRAQTSGGPAEWVLLFSEPDARTGARRLGFSATLLLAKKQRLVLTAAAPLSHVAPNAEVPQPEAPGLTLSTEERNALEHHRMKFLNWLATAISPR